MAKQTKKDKWNDLVKMSLAENEDGDYDAIIFASSKIAILEEWKEGANTYIAELENRIRELEREVMSLSFTKPQPIEFTEDDGTLRRLVWNDGDPSVGILAGYEPDDDVSFEEMKNKIQLMANKEWISIADKLPNDMDTIIVHNGKDVWCCTFIVYDEPDGPSFETEKGGSDNSVTHWQPLPSIRKG